MHCFSFLLRLAPTCIALVPSVIGFRPHAVGDWQVAVACSLCSTHHTSIGSFELTAHRADPCVICLQSALVRVNGEFPQTCSHTLHIVCASLGIRPQSNLFVGLHLSMGEMMRLSISLYDFQDCSDAPNSGLIGASDRSRTYTLRSLNPLPLPIALPKHMVGLR